MAAIAFRPAGCLAAILVFCGLMRAEAQWVEAPGSGWVQARMYHQDTRQRFDETGTLNDIRDEGHAISSSLYLTAAVGVFRGIDVWAEIPFHTIRYNDLADRRSESGFGEPRLYLRIGPELFHGPDIAVALRGGVKFARELTVDAEIIPLGEGQRDWELLLEAGQSFYPLPVYVAAWVGYRWREAQDELDRKPGDERFFYLMAGGNIDDFHWKVEGEAVFGDPPEFFGLSLVTDTREWLHLTPSVGWSIGPGMFSLGARVPLSGKNVTAGVSATLGYFFRWD